MFSSKDSLCITVLLALLYEIRIRLLFSTGLYNFNVYFDIQYIGNVLSMFIELNTPDIIYLNLLSC